MTGHAFVPVSADTASPAVSVMRSCWGCVHVELGALILPERVMLLLCYIGPNSEKCFKLRYKRLNWNQHVKPVYLSFIIWAPHLRDPQLGEGGIPVQRVFSSVYHILFNHCIDYLLTC